jgi:class 3 adenylate cyclase
MEVEKRRSTLEQPRTTEVRAFLICDIRGYSTFTSQRGDEAAAHLAMTFAGLAGDAVVARVAGCSGCAETRRSPRLPRPGRP